MNDKRKIVSCTIEPNKNFRLNGDVQAMCLVVGEDNKPEGPIRVAGWYSDELFFRASDFIGKTVDEACEMHVARDTAYLRGG